MIANSKCFGRTVYSGLTIAETNGATHGQIAAGERGRSNNPLDPAGTYEYPRNMDFDSRRGG